MLTLRQIVQQTCRVLALPVPAKVISNTEKNVLQMLGLMELLLDDLEQKGWYQQVVREGTFTSVATESQGSIHTHAPYGFVQFIPDTFFDRTTNLKVDTGYRPDEWQAMKAGPGVAGPFYRARLRNDILYLSPTPPAGDTMAFEYQSRYFLQTSVGDSTPLGSWTSDDNALIAPDSLGKAWLRFRWKREKGLDYAEDQADYETAFANLKIRDNSPAPIHMAGPSRGPKAGVVVPVGSWPT